MKTQLAGQTMPVHSIGTVIVGSGAAGFCAANSLLKQGATQVALVTENLLSGTSRNTGSDKQTYYKLTISGGVSDSVDEMAQTLFSGECVDGDMALAEAALSVKGFFHLAEIGVPFPSSRYGEYVGYKTDHDPKMRATSAGPLTSKLMTECLEREAAELGLKIFDKHQVIQVLHHEGQLGLLCLNDEGYCLFHCTNIILATGGPAKIYNNTVYPPSQTGASGLAFEAGVRGKNLTEWQYGLASVKPPWNVSGSFMQVLPRFVSTDQDGGDEREFLQDYLSDKGDLLSRIFLKGYQWPFDVRKCTDGSSLIDILVYQETVLKDRRVYMDFLSNPFGGAEIDFGCLTEEAQAYMAASGIQFGTPLERLQHMNMPAYEFYLSRGVDLAKEKLEIALCAQHNNGGMATDCWWQTNIEGCFSIGEACGSHGVYRPGGSALNAGQVGAMRAAAYVAAKRNTMPEGTEQFVEALTDQITRRIELGRSLLGETSNVDARLLEMQQAMDGAGASMRSEEKIDAALKKACDIFYGFSEIVCINSNAELGKAYQLYDILIAQITYLSAMKDYVRNGGVSRSSSLYHDVRGSLPHPALPEQFRYYLAGDKLSARVQEVSFADGACSFHWRDVRPLPTEDDFFENVWRSYRENKNVY